MDAAGSCLCGAVGFEVAFPTRWVAHCHCTMCQRAHGAAFVTWVGVPEAQFALRDGEGTLRWFASSEQGRRGFCSRCGSPLFFRSDRWPGEMHVARAAFHTPPDRVPQLHAFYETHVDWCTVDDALPRRSS